MSNIIIKEKEIDQEKWSKIKNLEYTKFPSYPEFVSDIHPKINISPAHKKINMD
jgi:hypothetical protein